MFAGIFFSPKPTGWGARRVGAGSPDPAPGPTAGLPPSTRRRPAVGPGARSGDRAPTRTVPQHGAWAGLTNSPIILIHARLDPLLNPDAGRLHCELQGLLDHRLFHRPE